MVRRLVTEHRLEPVTITGTGTAGRVTRDDVLARAAGTKVDDTDETVALNRIQLQTGANLLRSLQVAPHAFIAMEVDFELVDRARRTKKLSYLPFVARAVVDAVAAYPHVNASVGDGELLVHHDVHLGIAVDLDHQGLIVPVVRAAQDKRLVALAQEIADLAARARAKRLSPDDVTGGTFTITNGGVFGSLVSTPILNYPQVGILGLHKTQDRPIAVNGQVVIRPMMYVALSYDHRVIDGQQAVLFLVRVKELMEDPASMLVD